MKICARWLSLTPNQMSICFPDTAEGVALEFFQTHFSTDSPFTKISQAMSRLLNSKHHQQQSLSQKQSANQHKFMKERNHDSLSDGIDAIVAEINRIEPQPPDGFNTEGHELKHLREAVMSHQWADIAELRHKSKS